MKILDRYVIKESILPLLIGLGGFVVFVSVELLYQLSDIIVRYRVGFDKLLILLYYQLPYFLVMGIPVGVLFSIFWVISRFATSNEIVAIQVHGINLKRLVVPFMILSFILSGVAYLLNDFVVPKSNRKFEEARMRYIFRRNPEDALKMIETDTFVKIGNNKYFYIKRFDKKTDTFYNVLIYDLSSGRTNVIHAEKAYRKNNRWYLEKGRTYTVRRDGLLTFDMSFEEMELDIAKEIEEFVRAAKTPRSMTSRELKKKIEIFRKLGVRTWALEVEYQEKFSTSFAPVIIVILGVPVSLFFNVRSKSWSVILTFILVVLYQGSDAWISALGKEGMVKPALAPWIPNIVFGIVGAFLFMLISTKLMYVIKEFFSHFRGIILLPLLLMMFIPVGVQATELVSIEASSLIQEEENMVFLGGVKARFENMEVSASIATVTEKTFVFSGRVDVMGLEDVESIKSELLCISEDRATFTNATLTTSSEFQVLSSSLVVTFEREEEKRKVKEAYSENPSTVLISPDRWYRVEKFIYQPGESKFEAFFFRAKEKMRRSDGQEKTVWIGGPFLSAQLMEGKVATVTFFASYFTNCDYIPPHYELETKKMVITPERLLVGEDAHFEVLGFPLFYYPVYFTNLERRRQPMEVSFGLSRDKGFGFALKHNFDLWAGNGYMLYEYRGESSVRVNYEKVVKDDYTFKFNCGLPQGNIMMLLNKKFPGGINARLNVKSSVYEGGWRNDYLLSLSRKSGFSDYTSFSLSLLPDGEKTLRFPDYTLKNFKMSVFDILGITITYLKFTNLVYASSGMSVLDPQADLRRNMTLKGKYNFSKYGALENKGDYRFNFEDRNGETTSKFFLDHEIRYTLIDSKVEGSWGKTFQKINLYARAGVNTGDEATRVGVGLDCSLKYGAPTGNLSMELGYSLHRVKGENLRAFRYLTGDLHTLTLRTTLKPLPFVTLEVKDIKYEVEKSELLADPHFVTSSTWRDGNWKMSLKTNSVLSRLDGELKSTMFDTSLSYTGEPGKFSYSIAFNVAWDRDPLVDKMVSKFSLKLSKKWYFIKSLTLNGSYVVNTPFTDPEFYTFNMKGKIKLDDGEVNVKGVRYTLGRGWTLKLEKKFHHDVYDFGVGETLYYSGGVWKLVGGKAFVERELHKWKGRLNLGFAYDGKEWHFDSWTLKFWLKDFPEKFVEFFVSEREFGLSVGIF